MKSIVSCIVPAGLTALSCLVFPGKIWLFCIVYTLITGGGVSYFRFANKPVSATPALLRRCPWAKSELLCCVICYIVLTIFLYAVFDISRSTSVIIGISCTVIGYILFGFSALILLIIPRALFGDRI